MAKFTRSAGIGGLCAMLAGCLWGTTGLFLDRLYAAGLTTMQICVLRSAFTALLMLVLILIRDHKLLRIRLRHLWCFVGSGVFSILFFNYCYFSAIQESGMAVAATLLYTSPVFVMLLSLPLFGEKITARKTGALALTVGGCVLVSGIVAGGANFTPTGLLYGLGAGLGYALYSIFTRYALQRGYSSLTITIYTFAVATVGGLFLADIPALEHSLAQGGGPFLGLLVLYSLVTTVAPYMLFNNSLRHIENSKAAVLAAVEPISATMLGFLVLHQKPTVTEWVGIALVLTAILILNRPEKRRR